MRIGPGEARRIFETDPERWLYVLAALDDPIRRSGVTVFRAEDALAVVSDYAEETTVRLFSPDPALLAETASDPALGGGGRFCFCAGLPDELRTLPDGGSARIGGLTLVRDDARRTIDRFGLFGTSPLRIRTGLPEGFAVRQLAPKEEPDDLYLPDTPPWRAFADSLPDREPGDRILLVRNRSSGRAAGYLWTAEAGPGYDDIVNIFVDPEYRRRGIGRALLSRFSEEAEAMGRKAYYGYALSRESALLARSMGFREIYGETVSLYALPAE